MRRSLLFAIAASALLSLGGCDQPTDGTAGGPATVDPAGNPVEQLPAAGAPVGTEGGGGVVGASEIAWNHFGSEFTGTESIKAKALLASLDTHVDQTVFVEGTVVDVCQKAGCWLVLSDGGNQLRVSVKDHGFSVDKNGTGSWAKVEGVLRATEITAEVSEHLKGEAQRPDLAPEAGRTYEIVATGVAFQTTTAG